MKSYGVSKRGLVRSINEDKFYIQEPSLYILADGMGGHTSGEIASELAISSICAFLENYPSDWINEVTLKDAVLNANSILRKKIEENRTLEGMGTTILLVYIENSILFWAHVGDSRIYTYLRGTLAQVTHDHSLVGEWIDEGLMTKDQAQTHPARHVITRSVGAADNLLVDAGRLRLDQETMVLMCSDGLTSMINDSLIRDVMIKNERNPKSCAHDLLKSVYAAGAKDNVTIVTIAM